MEQQISDDRVPVIEYQRIVCQDYIHSYYTSIPETFVPSLGLYFNLDGEDLNVNRSEEPRFDQPTVTWKPASGVHDKRTAKIEELNAKLKQKYPANVTESFISKEKADKLLALYLAKCRYEELKEEFKNI